MNSSKMTQTFALLCFTVIVGCVVATKARSYTVSHALDLIGLFSNVTGSTLEADIELTADLDFSGSNFTIPLGAFYGNYKA